MVKRPALMVTLSPTVAFIAEKVVKLSPVKGSITVVRKLLFSRLGLLAVELVTFRNSEEFPLENVRLDVSAGATPTIKGAVAVALYVGLWI